MFFGFFQKQPIVFFGFSRFLVLENLENPKKPIAFFWIFPVFIENPKKHNVFFWILGGFIRKIQKTYGFFYFQ